MIRSIFPINSQVQGQIQSRGVRLVEAPGLEGIESTTGKDVAGLIIQHIEKNWRPNKTSTKGTG